MDLVEQSVKIIGVAGAADLLVELPQPMQHVAFQLGHIRGCDFLCRREPAEIAQQVTQRVSQTTIQVAHLLDDVGSDGQILRVIRGHDPQAQDVSP